VLDALHLSKVRALIRHVYPTRSRRSALLLCAGLIGLATAGVVYSPTLYRLFCEVTGYGGTVRRAAAATVPAQAAAGEMIRVSFDANVADGLNWEFRPEQSEVVATIGTPQTVYYLARNLSDKPVAAQAVFNVTPYQAAPYFFKIECFCFTEEKLEPGESARMPVVFYFDKAILHDSDAKALRRVTLSYTFYKQGEGAEAIAAARDLAGGSSDQAGAIREGGELEFANDAPRD
jgi:cytochrome c oxidase assembly protein subunit 11